jgi:hypothetical protein
VFRVCERGDTEVTSTLLEQPMKIVTRSIHDERLLDVKRQRIDLRNDTISGSVRTVTKGRSISIDTAARKGNVITIDDRNRRLGVASPKSSLDDADQARISFTPYISGIVNMPYPERALRKNESFPLRVRDTINHEDALPSNLAIDGTFVVREVTPQHVELACTGTYVERVQRGKERAMTELEITCRVRIDRRDGRTSRWWIDAAGKATWLKDPPMLVRAHYDTVVGRGPDAESVCARAIAPPAPPTGHVEHVFSVE